MLIDRRRLIRRHNPVIRQVESLAPLAVGNGEFAFTADITGLQSFPEQYEIPLGTQSQWGWHYSNGKNAHALSQLRLESFDTYGRSVGYPSGSLVPHIAILHSSAILSEVANSQDGGGA